MGSKKLKKKKVKAKKLGKLRKIKAIKINKTGSLECGRKSESVETLRQKNVSDRLFNKKYSRSCIGEKYISKVKYFSQIREHYFSYLQTVVTDNCVYCDPPVTGDTLENLSIDLEQHALLACLQADIYEKSMTKIISDIEKSTEEKQVHNEVKKLLPETAPHVKTELARTNLATVELYSQIPTISSTRTDVDLTVNGSEWTEQPEYNSPNPFDHQYQDPYPDINANEPDLNWDGRENYISNSNYWNGEASHQAEGHFPDFENPVMSTNLVQLGNHTPKAKPISRVPPQTSVELEKPDFLIASRNQLQKLVEQTLSQSEKVNRERKDEKERAYIAHILEGDDSLDDRLYDSLSDNENESKENVDESNLMDRLEKMRELFGVEEEETVKVADKPKTPCSKVNPPRTRRPTIWKHEKVIHLYKFSMLSSEMTSEMRERNRKLFLEFFGEDSDEEHEEEYRCQEKYRASCTERISSWVVKHLMPFYHEKRIIGRTVFKSLGHHISDSMLDKIQYPDEWTVKYFVSKFFPPKKKYVCDAEVFAFQPD